MAKIQLTVLSLFLIILVNISYAQNTNSIRNNNTVRNFIQKLMIIEKKTSIMDNLSISEQSSLIIETKSLRGLLSRLSSSADNKNDISACTDAVEALVNFIQASIKVNRHARQDWEDYTNNKNACFALLK